MNTRMKSLFANALRAATVGAVLLGVGAASVEAQPRIGVPGRGGFYGGGYHGGGHYHGGGRGIGPGVFWGGLGLGIGVAAASSYYYNNPAYYGYAPPVYYSSPVYAAPVYTAPVTVVEPAYVTTVPAPTLNAGAPGYAPGSGPATTHSQPLQGNTSPAPIFYPRSGQSSEQTERDRQECNRWATTQQDALNNAEIFQRATLACMDGRGYTVR